MSQGGMFNTQTTVPWDAHKFLSCEGLILYIHL
jgi:hypothetical protein